MKFFKGIIIAFFLSFIFSISGVSGTVYQSYVDFKLPAYGGIVDAGTLTKSDYKKHVMGVLSSKDTRDISVRLKCKGLSGKEGTSPWVIIEITENSDSTEYSHVQEFFTETSSEAYGMVPGNVKMDMKARNWYLDKTWFNGTWYVSVDVYHALNP